MEDGSPVATSAIVSTSGTPRRMSPAISNAVRPRSAASARAAWWASAVRSSPRVSLRKAIPSRIFSTDLAPNPLAWARRPSVAAACSSSNEVTPRSLTTVWTFLGPRPGTRRMSGTPGGTRATSSSSSVQVPVSTISATAVWVAGPMPRTSESVPAAARSAAGSASVSISRAVRPYVMARRASSPRTPSSVSICRKTRAISLFVRPAMVDGERVALSRPPARD